MAVRINGQSPWGPIQNYEILAPGVWQVHTAGHGGIKLSAERNAKVPKLARNEDGWYEEDCEYAIPAFVHKDVGDVLLAPARKVDPDKFGDNYLRECLKRWQSPEVLTALGIADQD